MDTAEKPFGGSDSVDWLLLVVTPEASPGGGCSKAPEQAARAKQELECWECNPSTGEAEPGGCKIIV